jgi:glycosyltransferase involved in cell wall biosynthesis
VILAGINKYNKQKIMLMKLCVFPNDPLKEYFKKGEIKKRYFNPNNFFDEIHVISFVENDINVSEVKELAGNANFFIHSVGKIKITERKKKLNRIQKIVEEISPNVIRAYNPRLEGWFAAKISENLNIPFFLSLHTQHENKRNIAKKTNFKKFLALTFTNKMLEPYVIQRADKITIVYKIIESYVRKLKGNVPELLYNGIDCERFATAKELDDLPKPLVLSVGNLIKEKNHECLINAMKNVNANCLIIGKGEHHNNLVNLIHKLHLENKITIKEKVPNNEIQSYYKSAKVFALAYDPELEGIPKPVIEALATGIPVVIPFPKKGFSDGLEDVGVLSERTPQSFAKNIQKLLSNEDLWEQCSRRSLKKSQEFDTRKIEKRESEIYAQLISQ